MQNCNVMVKLAKNVVWGQGTDENLVWGQDGDENVIWGVDGE